MSKSDGEEDRFKQEVRTNERTNEHIREYRHRHMPIGISNKTPKAFPNQVKLYIPEYASHTFLKLREILRREGTSISKWFRKEAEAYVNLHWPGNPQRPLTVFTEPQEPAICETRSCDRNAAFEVHFSNKTKKLCALCLAEVKRKQQSPYSYRKIGE